MIPWGMRKRTAQRYAEAYREALEASTNTVCAEGDARREANTRLRLFVERATKISNGAVSKPPKIK